MRAPDSSPAVLSGPISFNGASPCRGCRRPDRTRWSPTFLTHDVARQLPAMANDAVLEAVGQLASVRIIADSFLAGIARHQHLIDMPSNSIRRRRGVWHGVPGTPRRPPNSFARPAVREPVRIVAVPARLPRTCDQRRIKTRTGPSRPDSIRGVSAVKARMLVRVRRCSGGCDASPMIRLGQKFTTLTSTTFPLGFRCAVQLDAERGCPDDTERATVEAGTSASSRTSPRSRTRVPTDLRSGRSNVCR